MEEVSAEKIRLLGLIGLLALYGHDRVEYLRATDLPKDQLEREIAELKSRLNDKECNGLHEELLQSFGDNFLLGEIHKSAQRRAQVYSIHFKDPNATRLQ